MKQQRRRILLIIALAAVLGAQSVAASVAAGIGSGDKQAQAGVKPSVGGSCGLLDFNITEYTSVDSPIGLAIGDFNADGKPDLVVSSGTFHTSGAIAVLLNQGNGSFAAPIVQTIGGHAFSAVTGDFNHDGKLDVATLHADNNRDQNFISVLLGNGDGSLQAEQRTATGFYPNDITIADFNGDGNLDLATSNNGDSTVTVLQGNGSGQFQIVGSYIEVGLSPLSIISNDFNADDKADLAVTNGASNSVAVMLGNGDSTFQRNNYYWAGRTAQGLAAADLTGDGIVDLLTDGNGGGPRLLVNDGSGHFGPSLHIADPIYANAELSGDYDGDGKLDIVTASSYIEGINLFRGDGTGNFASPHHFTINNTRILRIAKADFDGDGKLDLAATLLRDHDDKVAVLLNRCATVTGTPATSTPTFSPTPTLTPYPTDTPCAVPFTDIAGNAFVVAIGSLYCHQVVNGYGSTYHPAENTDRAQLAKMLDRSISRAVFDCGDDFSDISFGHYACPYTTELHRSGIINGFPPATCAALGRAYPCYIPQTPITRVQVTKMVVIATGQPLYTPPSPSFNDLPPTHPFYAYVETAVHLGLVSGYPDGSFRPDLNIRRDEMAQIIYMTAQELVYLHPISGEKR